RHTLCQPPGIDEDEGGTVLGGKRRDPVVDFGPHFVGRYRAKLTAGNLDGQVELATMTDLHDYRVGPIGASQKLGQEFDRLLRCGKTDAREALPGQIIQTFERERQVGAALVVSHRVNLVYDNGLDGSQDVAAPRGSQQDIQGFRSGYQNMRW